MEYELLISSAQKGDIQAFEQLVALYEKKIYSIAYNMMSNREDAQDIAQDVILKVYRSIRSFNGNCSISVWIHRITVNTCIDALRKRKHNQISIDSMDENGVQIPDCSEQPDHLFTQKIVRQKIHEAIHSLKSEYKALILLRDVQGMSYQEISQITGLSLGTVKSRINRGRAQLQQKLAEYWELLI